MRYSLPHEIDKVTTDMFLLFLLYQLDLLSLFVQDISDVYDVKLRSLQIVVDLHDGIADSQIFLHDEQERIFRSYSSQCQHSFESAAIRLCQASSTDSTTALV